MKIKEVREKSVADLPRVRSELKQEMLNLRMQQRSGQLENPSRLRILRRGVARIETVLSEVSNKAAAK